MGEIEERVDALRDLVRQLAKATEDTEGNPRPPETVRVVLDLPKSSVVFAAWLLMTQRARSDGEHTVAPIPSLGPESVKNTLRPRAKAWLMRTIADVLEKEWLDLYHHEHHFLSPPPKRQPELDDGLPF